MRGVCHGGTRNRLRAYSAIWCYVSMSKSRSRFSPRKHRRIAQQEQKQPELTPAATLGEHLAQYVLEQTRRDSELSKSGHARRSDVIDLHQLDLVAGDGSVR